jgi:hypothetical protein
MDGNVVPQRTGAMEDTLDLFEFARPRFGLTLFSVFAAIGLILVSVGVYSVVSYTVSRQSYESESEWLWALRLWALPRAAFERW